MFVDILPSNEDDKSNTFILSHLNDDTLISRKVQLEKYR